MADSNPPEQFKDMVELSEYAKTMPDIDEMIKFVEAENLKLDPPWCVEDINCLLNKISTHIRETQPDRLYQQCLEEMKNLVPDDVEDNRLEQVKNFVKCSNLLKLNEDEALEIIINTCKKFKLTFELKSVITKLYKRLKGKATNKNSASNAKQKEEQGATEESREEYPQWAVDKANETLELGEALSYILGVWQKRHVGDTNIGENCACSFITSRILNSKRGLHIKPSGESGKGKSDAIECFLELLPRWAYITGSMSAKALFYDKNIRPGTLVYADDAHFGDDVIATIKQSTSKFQTETIHKTVVNGVSEIFTIPPRTTFWFSTVEGFDDEPLANRFLQANVDNSSEQDERVFNHQVESEAWYESDDVEPDILICMCIFDILLNQFFRVKIPYVDAITWNNKENRRNFDKFKDIIRSLTVYNYRKRDVIDGFLISTPKDYEEALKIYKGTSVNNATNLTDTEIRYLRFIVTRANKTTSLRELVNYFKVTETAVRHMLNGKKGDGGLLAKIKQLIVIDGSQTVKSGDVTSSTREKRYQYTGDFAGLDMYESISDLDMDEVARVTPIFMALLHENALGVTQGNPKGNLVRVTLENDINRYNNNNNNTRVTQYIEERAVDNYVCPPVVESNSPDELTHAQTEVPLSSEKTGLPSGQIGRVIAETRVTPGGYPRVRVGYPSPINDTRVTENMGYPSTEKTNSVQNNKDFVHLKMDLRTTKRSYEMQHGGIPDINTFIDDFFKRGNNGYLQLFSREYIVFEAEKICKTIPQQSKSSVVSDEEEAKSLEEGGC